MIVAQNKTRPGVGSRAGSQLEDLTVLSHDQKYQKSACATTASVKPSSAATWKFEFADTVQADPRAKGSCLAVIRAYLHFASKSDPHAFCSLSELMLRTASSKPAVQRAKVLLEKLGYLIPQYVTDEGAVLYKLMNSRKQLIDDHLRVAREKLASDKRDRKRRERRRMVTPGGNETITPEIVNLERNDTPVGNETLPNSVEELRGVFSIEGSDGFSGALSPSDSNAYPSAWSHDLAIPFGVPDDDSEAQNILAQFGNVHPIIRTHLHKMLMAGELTPLMLQANLGGYREG